MKQDNESSKYILSIDAGTTGITALLINKEKEIHAKEYTEIKQFFPKLGWVEHDPTELIEKVKHIINALIEKAKIRPQQIAAIGITNQRETVIVWNKHTGKPIYNAIVWQCRRTTQRCNELKQTPIATKIKEKTGLVCDPYFSATKIEWILQNSTESKENLLCGTIDTWIVWNLTKEKAHVTDTSNASRTMLFNIHTKEWDEELCTTFNIPKNILPTVKESSEVYGHGAIGTYDIPIAGIAGDQQAALFGQCCFEKGEIKNTYGTGCFTLLNTGKEANISKNALTTIAWTFKGTTYYALEGSVFVAGAAVQWLRDGLQIIENAEETEQAALSIEDNGHVYVVPALTGLGCPYWDPNARGTIIGITRATTKEHIIRATVEAIAYQSKDVIETMAKEANINIAELKADGGASSNKFLMQFQADICPVKIQVPKIKETTALGAAFLAGLAVGFWESQEEIKKCWKAEKEYHPNMEEAKRNDVYNNWKRAVERSRNWH